MIDIYLDCADLDGIRAGKQNPLVRGFTTNPTLMAKAGVTDYERFAKDALQIVEGLPISFEVFSDEWDDMERQARKIASWGTNVNVKIPVTNTKGESAAPLIECLECDGIFCNVTAVFTVEQVKSTYEALQGNTGGIISIFAGRIADTINDPVGLMYSAVMGCMEYENLKILWASTREALNIKQAEQCGCHIITVTPDLLAKYEKLKNKDLTEYSLDTCKMFYDDAKKVGFQL